MLKKISIILFSLLINQEVYTEYIIENSDTLDIFSYQLPSGYTEANHHPVLVAFHQWGGNQNSPYSTLFDEEANLRNWIFLSPFGGSSNNYNHQEAQRYVELALLFLIENFTVNEKKIYMVGGSMGGASGAIYANNHLNPTKPMVAATASASGILDCERRYYEMDGNNSMTEWFGGSPEQVPFEYHRNSAVYFEDLTNSMHFNLKYTPIYLDFGSTEPHRYHAEDLYNLIQGYNANVWIDENSTPGHGYSVIDEAHACDWLSHFALENNPDTINVNLDEPSRAYWLEAYNQIEADNFIKLEAQRCHESGYCIDNLNNSDTLIFHIINDYIPSDIQFYNNQQNPMITIGITGESPLIYTISNIEFEPLSNYTIWNNLNQQSNVIYVDISPGDYEISFDYNADTNQDGEWDILDVTLIANFIIENIFPNQIEFMNSDINQNQILDILDLILIINIILEN